MRRSRVLHRLFLTSGAMTLLYCGVARTEEPEVKAPPRPTGEIQLVQQPGAKPAQPLQPVDTAPSTALAAPTSGVSLPQGLFGPTGGAPAAEASAGQQAAATTPGANVVSGLESVSRATTDAGDLVGKSQSAVGVVTQRRSPIITDPRIRSYHVGQVITQADGAFWFPARTDLDTIVSKIDSSSIRNMVVIKGPYSARYGPGFSFLDIETEETPRYECFEWHGRTYFTYKNNGEQFYGRQSFWGGDEHWGFRVAYGHRTGNDYTAGDEVDIPASYNSRDFDAALGFTLSPDSRLELKLIRLDQTNVEIPQSIFDLNYLVTDGYAARYVVENQGWFDLLTLDGWYNRTRFAADTRRKRAIVPALDDVFGSGANFRFTLDARSDVDQLSTGYRLGVTWGQPRDPQLTVGVDLRFMNQELVQNENFTLLINNQVFLPGFFNFVSAVPRSHWLNPGAYVELSLPVTDDLVVKAGGRYDWVATDIDRLPPEFDLSELQAGLRTLEFGREFNMVSAFTTVEYSLTEEVALTAGAGFAQRPPTLTELYAVGNSGVFGPILGLLQRPAPSVLGEPDLDSEKLVQLDTGVRVNSERFRAGGNAFFAWIKDYITFDSAAVTPPGQAQGVNVFEFVNTDLATLWGAEAYAELDLTDMLTPFGTLSYVEGTDRARDRFSVGSGGAPSRVDLRQEPLPGIPPLDSRAGLRFHEAGRNPSWGVEFTARMVNHQDRVAASLDEQLTPGFTTFDIRSYWQVSQNLILTGGVENLGDKTYLEHLDSRTLPFYRQPGRTYYFGVELRY